VLALLVAKQWKRIIIFGLALFTHVQSALLIATFFISKVLDKNTKLWVKIIISLICIIGFTGAFLLMQEHIVNKLGAYSEGTEEDGNGFISMIKTGVFIFLAGISTFRILPVISGIPLVLLSYFLGSERIGMLAFILYVCAVIYYKKKADLLLFLVMLYFTIKTPSFILNILNYGVGYISNS
ncbi:hypothetical protein HLI08_17395, partial [Acinetobacter baumannii]|nr:hypothetical protein [Acinetobacter baumannii]